MNPLISIVVPIYNVERFLKKCIDSIINQTYTNLEILLIDDGSSDGSTSICEDYLKKDERIRFFKKQNGGLSDARNVGIDNSSGSYICFIDADDYVSKDYVQRMYSALAFNESDICVCNFSSVEEDGSKSKKEYGAKLINSTFSRESINSIFISNMNISMTVAWNKIYKKDLFKEIRYPVGKLHEDEWTTYKLLYKCSKVCTISDELYYYVQRLNSITYSKKKIQNAFDIFDAYFERHNYGKKNKNKALLKDSINKCVSELRNIIETYEYNFVGKRVWKEFIKLLFKCPLYIRQYFYKLKLFRKIILEFFEYNKTKRIIDKIIKLSNQSKQHVIMLGTPVHNNLGDQAIVVAEKRFLLKLGFKKGNIFEFQTDVFNQYSDSIFDSVSKSSIVIIDGGGNLGSYWPNEHKRILKILSLEKKCPIIMFPETVYYNERDFNKEFLFTDLPVFLKANCLYMLRDKWSYDFFEAHLNQTRHIYVPDIVFSLAGTARKKKKRTKRVALIFRNDKEKVVNNVDIIELKKLLKQKGYVLEELSTISKHGYISKSSRDKEIRNLFKKISKTELVITDRLHGMIFSYVNNTKCYALNNSNRKVEGSYYWISGDANYIVRDNIDVSEILNLLKMCKRNSQITVDFSEMQMAVREWIKIKE